MRMPRVSFLLLLGVSFLLPYTRVAHGERPPDCCPASRLAPVTLNESGATLALQGQFVVSDQMLRSQATTRSRYVDQLSTALFPNKSVNLVLPLKDVPRLVRANVKDLDTLDQVGLTDGVLYVAISFVR